MGLISFRSLVRTTLETNSVQTDHLDMALIEFPIQVDDDLHVDSFGLSIGDVSVGLPMSCTADTVLLRYLDLVRLRTQKGRDVGDVDAHVAVLATAVRLDAGAVRQRLSQLAG